MLSQKLAGKISAVLDCLLPGDERWPAAGSHGLEQKFYDLLCQSASSQQALALLETLGEDFTDLEKKAQTNRLHDVERQQSETFEQMIVAAYSAYYTDAGVRRIIEQLTGYPARPPQPLGYTMPPFDETLLNNVRQRQSQQTSDDSEL